MRRSSAQMALSQQTRGRPGRSKRNSGNQVSETRPRRLTAAIAARSLQNGDHNAARSPRPLAGGFKRRGRVDLGDHKQRRALRRKAVRRHLFVAI